MSYHIWLVDVYYMRMHTCVCVCVWTTVWFKINFHSIESFINKKKLNVKIIEFFKNLSKFLLHTEAVVIISTMMIIADFSVYFKMKQDLSFGVSLYILVNTSYMALQLLVLELNILKKASENT